MVRCGLSMQQCAMHYATIQKNFFELGVYVSFLTNGNVGTMSEYP